MLTGHCLQPLRLIFSPFDSKGKGGVGALEQGAAEWSGSISVDLRFPVCDTVAVPPCAPSHTCFSIHPFPCPSLTLSPPSPPGALRLTFSLHEVNGCLILPSHVLLIFWGSTQPHSHPEILSDLFPAARLGWRPLLGAPPVILRVAL